MAEQPGFWDNSGKGKMIAPRIGRGASPAKETTAVKNTILFVLALAATCALAPARAVTVDPTAFSNKFYVTFSGYAGSTTLTDFPVLVRLSASRNKFDYAACAANGADLRFADADGNLLSHEIDTWDPTGESLVWVKVPSLTSETVVTAYYGCANPPAVDPTDVWSNGYVGVWHLNGSTVQMLKDSSSTGADVTTKSTGVVLGYENGAIGDAVDMSSAGWGNRLDVNDHDNLDGFTNFTLEMWTKQSEYLGSRAMLAKRGTSDLSYYWYTNPDKDTAPGALVSTNGTGTLYVNQNTGKPALDVWTHQAFLRDTTANHFQSFIGGVSTWTSPDSKGTEPIWAGSAPLQLGGWYHGSGQSPFKGQIDEVRISRVARSSDWIKATSDCVTDSSFATCFFDPTWADYSHVFTMTFTGYAGSETLENFPVLVKVSPGSPAGFSYTDCLKPNGGDLRFADANGNLLPSEVDTWNPNGTSLIWVRVPALTSSTKITAYYGLATAHAVVASNVWANGYVGVWHMKESALPLAESSGVSTPFSYKQGNVVLGYAAGAIGAAVDCSGASSWFDVLRADDDDDLDGFTAFTLEMWTKQPEGTWSTTSNYGMMEKRPAKNTETSGNSYYWYENKDKAGAAGVLFYTGEAGSAKYGTGNTVKPDPDVWTHQAFVRTTGTNRRYYSYVCGTNAWSTASGNDDPVTASSSYLIVGGSGSGGRFPGQIDEVRISRAGRSADWIQATHDTVAKNGIFTQYGAVRNNRAKPVVIFVR